MAAIVFDPDDVLGDGSDSQVLPAGELIDAGEWVYKKKTNIDSVEVDAWFLAECDASLTDNARSIVLGIAKNSALKIGQLVDAQKKGVVTVDAAAGVVRGGHYILDGMPGKMCPVADQATNDWVTQLCVGLSTTEISLAIKAFLVKAA